MKSAPTKPTTQSRTKGVQFMLRLTKARHEQLKATSARTGVSLNTLINQALDVAGDQVAPEVAFARYRIGLLRAKPSLTEDEKLELTYILSTWKELQS